MNMIRLCKGKNWAEPNCSGSCCKCDKTKESKEKIYQTSRWWLGGRAGGM